MLSSYAPRVYRVLLLGISCVSLDTAFVFSALTNTHIQFDYDHYSELFDDLKWLEGKNQLGKNSKTKKKGSGDSSNGHAHNKKAESGSPDQDDLMFPAGLATFAAGEGVDEVDYDEDSAEMHKLKVRTSVLAIIC